MSRKRRIALAGTVTVAGLMLAACGGSGGDGAGAPPKSDVQVPVAATGAPNEEPSPAPTDSPSASPSASPSSTPSTAAGRRWKGWLSLAATKNDTLGTTVVDGKGFTLYRFDKDTAKPSVSNCFGSCAKTWPPVKFTPKLKLKGIPRSAIGNIMTKDGICQATIGGWPIYRYSKDTAPGQTNGQGVGGTWFAIAPDGTKAGGGKVPAANQGNRSGTDTSGY
jgi:predicted lipoprotein with Yx(FWY)xxD motif